MHMNAGETLDALAGDAARDVYADYYGLALNLAQDLREPGKSDTRRLTNIDEPNPVCPPLPKTTSGVMLVWPLFARQINLAVCC